MKELPPELLSSIVEHAGSCDSTMAAYRSRIHALSSLALVNHTLHQYSQPLLVKKVLVDSEKEWDWWEKQVPDAAVIESLALFARIPDLRTLNTTGTFAALRELRIVAGYVEVHQLESLPQLVRLSLQYTRILDRANSCLRTLEELSVDSAQVECEDGPDPFLKIQRFPSLRALGTRLLAETTIDSDHDLATTMADPLLSRLDCLVTDDVRDLLGDARLSPSSRRQVVPPVLFDLNPSHTTTSWGRSSLAPGSALAQTHVRIRLPCEPIPHRRQIEAALFLVETLLNDSTALKELYLDLFPRDGRRGYELDEELAARIERIQDPNRKTKAKIVWENHEDDWCQSRVSKEFWKRCKRRKEMLAEASEWNTVGLS